MTTFTDRASRVRRCHGCGEPTVHLAGRKRLRLGMSELAYECTTCGGTFTTFDLIGHVVWWLLFATLNIGFLVAAIAGKVKDGDGPLIATGILALDLFGGVIGGRALANDRRNPPVA